LKEFVGVNVTPETLAERLTMGGLEVESLTHLREPGTGRDEWLFEVGVTPNRGDCLGIAGLAREVVALGDGQPRAASLPLAKKAPSLSKRIRIEIEEPRLCSRYSARIADEVRIAPSPPWMRFRLEACGVRPINNVVDITNYVMLETGQPLHAFDMDRLRSRHIVVRAAKEILSFTTLDGIERELAAEDLLICDAGTPIALAGIMGGRETEVREDTRSLLLESANFDPTSIRRTAKRLALRTEASHRFERGVDPEGTVGALNRALSLLAQLAAGVPVSGVADRYLRRPKVPNLSLREERIEKLLGVSMKGSQAEKLLRSLGLKTRRQASSRRIKVVPPSYRLDLTREADLIEELARLYGYQKIPSTFPLLRSPATVSDYRLGKERRVRSFLAGEGLVEVINLPFTSEWLNGCFTGLWDGTAKPVSVLNPLAKENAEMRLSLIPGLIENLRLNLAFKAQNFWGYHCGKVFCHETSGDTRERQAIAGVLYGARSRRGLRAAKESSAEFLDCKGLVEGILDLLGVEQRATWSACGPEALHPGQRASVCLAETPLGYLGQLHPDLCERWEVKPFWLFELDFDGLLQYAPRQITVQPLPKFPAVERDFAVVVDRAFPSWQIISWIDRLKEDLIEHVQVFDQYLGPPIPEGKKSLAYKIFYRASDRTLTDSEVSAIHQGLLEQMCKQFGAELRS
jgi:phenylalanyl-tRNA synthetase beta chain